MNRTITAIASAAWLLLACGTAHSATYDVVIIGGGASGVAAAVQSSRMNSTTLVIEQYSWLGGMLTSAGVSATDGNYKLKGGFWGELRDSLETHYNGSSNLSTGWVSNMMFEPSVGNAILKNMVGAQKNLAVWYNSTVANLKKTGNRWQVNVDNNGIKRTIYAKVIIDATELGDIAKMAGVTYRIGMDSRHDTAEDIAPSKTNSIIQDLTYVMVLKDYGHDVSIARPEGYNPSLFYCSCINDKCVSPKEQNRRWSKQMMITYGKLPNNKYMINWPIEGNDYYVDIIEMTSTKREEALKKAKNHSLCFLYYIQTELGFKNLALADDEFPTADRLPFIPYHRESRRIDGMVRFTLNDICKPFSQQTKLYRTTIGVGDYPVDQHHTRYSGWADLPNLYFHAIPSYGLPLGVMIPRHVQGLIVAEKSISVTNIVNGSTRLQPVVLQIGQAAGALAAIATKQGLRVGEVSVRQVQAAILEAGGYILPYLDRAATDPNFKAIQRIGATGIIKGVGTNVGWENQTWFQADSIITPHELIAGMREVYPQVKFTTTNNTLTISQLSSILAQALQAGKAAIERKITDQWGELALTNYDHARNLTRLECAVIIDRIANPFATHQVDIQGNFLTH